MANKKVVAKEKKVITKDNKPFQISSLFLSLSRIFLLVIIGSILVLGPFFFGVYVTSRLTSAKQDIISLKLRVNELEKAQDEQKQPQITPKAEGVIPTITPTTDPSALTSITFIRPLPEGCGEFSKGFSWYHGGVDLAEEDGCWINAAAKGKVTFAGWKETGEGFTVEIDHGKGVTTVYEHGSGEFKVEVGDEVVAGQQIMYMGQSGKATGTHLHFELRLNGTKINPETVIPGLK